MTPKDTSSDTDLFRGWNRRLHDTCDNLFVPEAMLL